ncbi:MAG: quinol monooxygenase YgiN [Paracoccaceae bacterium]|jgi:quinol monooxygenase YgiN
MINHCVMLKLRADHDAGELQQVMAGLAALVGQIDGFLGFEHGPNIDLEGKSQDYAAGFVARFESRASLEAYAANPDHRALGARLVAQCLGGGDGISVFDIESAL